MTTPFEESENTIRDRMLDRVSEDWDKEEGGFIYDAVAPVPLEIKQLQVNQDSIFRQSFALYAEGQNLDDKVIEAGLTRNQATAAKRTLTVDANIGVVIPKGTVFSTTVLDENGNPLEFTADTAASTFPADVVCTCKTLGTAGNVPPGVSWVIIPGIVGVKGIANAGGKSGDVDAVDTEDDDSLRARYLEKIRNPGGSGSKADYIKWAYDIAGVGGVKVLPLWNGRGTVKVVIVNSDKGVASAELIAAVQAYIDPNANGDGSGVAPIGATVTVVTVTTVAIDVAATVTLKDGYTLAAVKTAFEAALDVYLGDAAFVSQTVFYTQVGAALSGTEGVADYDPTSLTINSGTANITLTETQIPVKGTVTLA